MANVFPLSFPPRPNNPSPFGFGFGGTPSSPSHHQSPIHSPSPSSFGSPLRRPQPTTPSASGFGRPYQPPSPSPFAQFGVAAAPSLKRTRTAPSTSSAGEGSSSKRRARDDDSSEEDNDHEMGGAGAETGAGRRKIAGGRGGGVKKSRVELERAFQADGSPEKQAAPGAGESEDGVDVGVLLALLPQSSLLPILTSLLKLHPTLKPSLLTLIPTPSLSSALDALRLADEKIRQAVPFGWSPAGGGVSEAYVLGRIQAPVQELASLIQSHLPFFTAPHPLPTSQPPHPLTTFPYLQQTTVLLFRLASTLPSPLTPLDLLWPKIAQEWLCWTAAVSDLVNEQGGMVGAGVADGWVRELDGFASGSKGARALEARMRAEMWVVRERWVGEVGWLVNRRVGDQSGLGGQQDVGMGMMEEEEL